jgi:hypothetical protein
MWETSFEYLTSDVNRRGATLSLILAFPGSEVDEVEKFSAKLNTVSLEQHFQSNHPITGFLGIGQKGEARSFGLICHTKTFLVVLHQKCHVWMYNAGGL